MQLSQEELKDLEFHPVSKERWNDLETFFHGQGNANYCWCMYWRLKSTEFKQLSSEERQEKMKALVQANTPVGILGYRQGEPVGWCSIAPRETYAHLESSTTLTRIDDLPTWSVACFVVDPGMRGKGLPTALLRAGIDYAASKGATVIEGYPVGRDDPYRFMGSQEAFAQMGFREAAVAKNGRRIVRFHTNMK